MEDYMNIEKDFLSYSENLWLKYWLRTHKYLTILSNELVEKLEANSPNSYTFEDVKNILFEIDSLAGFEITDSFEYESKELESMFNSNNLRYKYFLRCRHIHNVVQKELLENTNPQVESDSTAVFQNKHLHILVQIMLQSPRMWGDPWSPDWESKK